MKPSMRAGLLSCAAVCTTGFAVPVYAGEAASSGNELEEIIVTAERRTTDVQSVAASVSVRTGDELAAEGKYTTRQILEDIPGLSAVDNNSVNVGGSDVQGNNITIRGIRPGAGAGGGPSGISAAPGTAVYVDGVYEGVGSGYDIDRVEVLRGPQGTLYGRSATAGVVAFHTRNPTLDTFGGNAAVEFGNYDLQHYTAAVNIPLTQTLAVRVSGDYRDQGEGYYDNASRGMSKSTNGRAKFLWKPSEDFSLLVGFAYAKNQAFSGGASTSASLPTLAETSGTLPVQPGFKYQRQYWAEANWNLGPVTVTYQPAYRTWTQNDIQVPGGGGLSPWAPFGYGQRQFFKVPTDDFTTHELRVASREGAAIAWQAGAFYYHNALLNNNHNFLINPDGSEYSVLSDTTDKKDTKALGFFAEATIPLGSVMRMTLGVRYDDTKVLVDETYFDNIYALCGTAVAMIPGVLPPGTVCTGVATATVPPPPAQSLNGVKLDFRNFNYKARLEYDLTQKNMLFGMISTGFRPGDAGIASHRANYLDSEKLTSIEVGSKNRFLDDSLQLNAGVFYYNYRGVQTSYVVTPIGINNSIPVTVPAKNIGGELELLYRLTAHDRFGLNYNYVQSRWYDKPAAFAAAQPEDKRALTPTTITANYEHLFFLPGGSSLTARIDGKFESKHLSTDLHAYYLGIGYGQYFELAPRTIGNLSAVWASDGGKYSVSAYVRNFTDKQYVTYGTSIQPATLSATYSDPRTYGAQAAVRF